MCTQECALYGKLVRHLRDVSSVSQNSIRFLKNWAGEPFASVARLRYNPNKGIALTLSAIPDQEGVYVHQSGTGT